MKPKLIAFIFCISLLALWNCSKNTFKNIDNLQHPDSSYLPLIFLCGQSNMEGVDYENVNVANFIDDIPNAYIFYKPSNTAKKDGKIETLKFGRNNNWRNPARHFGPEEGIAYDLTQAGHRIAIVKYAYGGSKLSFTGTSSPNGYWQTDADDTLNHYKILIHNWAKQSLDAFKNAGYKPYIAAFVWCQGESDAHDGAAAERYRQNFTQLLNKFKKDLAGIDSFVNDMRVIITRTRNNYPYSNKIRDAEVAVAETYHNAYWIDSDAWPLLPDDIHFTALAQATMQGKAIAQILEKVIP